MKRALQPERDAALTSGAALGASAGVRAWKTGEIGGKVSSQCQAEPELISLPKAGPLGQLCTLSEKQDRKKNLSTGEESLRGNLPVSGSAQDGKCLPSACKPHAGWEFEVILPARPKDPRSSNKSTFMLVTCFLVPRRIFSGGRSSQPRPHRRSTNQDQPNVSSQLKKSFFPNTETAHHK